jgi:hypothetical protein
MPLGTDPVSIDTNGSPTAEWAAIVHDGNGNPIPQIYQEQTEWCWAACAQMVLQFYGEDAPQCALATQLLGEACCDNPSDPLCNEPAPVPNLASLYGVWGHNAVLANGDVSFETLQDEVGINQPVEIGFSWGDGTGHQILVCGWNIDSQGGYLLVNDPRWGSGPVYYVNLQAAYGWGTWLYTWSSIT